MQCYKELKPGMYGDMGKPMEGPNLWYDSWLEFIYWTKIHTARPLVSNNVMTK